MYEPNNEFDRARIISTLASPIHEDDNEIYIETILGGDRNCVLDNKSDRKLQYYLRCWFDRY